MIYSASALSLWQQCPKKYKLKYFDKAEKAESADSAIAGRDYHAALAGEPCSDYAKRLAWKRSAHMPAPVACREERFEVRIKGIQIHGYLDGIDDDFVYEYKTTGLSPAQFWDGRDRNLQCAIYAMATGKPVVTEAFYKPKVKRRQLEPPSDFEARQIESLGPWSWERRTFPGRYAGDEEDIRGIVAQIEHANRNYPRNLASCRDYWHACEYEQECRK